MARVIEFTVDAQRLEEDESEEGSDGKGRLTPTLKNAPICGVKPRSRTVLVVATASVASGQIGNGKGARPGDESGLAANREKPLNGKNPRRGCGMQ
jgi:hypothetical protein